jgi:4-amino-4-deoxy-L-arabinose transferase-like glycosyltransferase
MISGIMNVPAWLIAILLALLALLPRAAGLADFYTTDEAYFWQGRVHRFTNAVVMGDWAATNQTGHPGVTTMWLGSLGQRLAGADGAASPVQGAGAGTLAALRLPLAITNALAVAAGYLLLRRLLRPGTALLAGLLWAASPFLIAHGRLLHLDALLTSFMSLSLLCLLVATRPRAGPARPAGLALVGAGLLAGLALLTKAPALLLLPVSGLILLAAELRGARGWWRGLGAATGRALLSFAAWLTAAAAAVFALWPALWVGPAAALGDVLDEILGNGAQPHSTGNFFMGRAVADPGWLFYPAVIVWRGEVPVLAGLAALLALTARDFVVSRRGGAPAQPPWYAEHAGEAWAAAALGAFVVAFTLALSLLAKKFDRYLLPAWPSLATLGAIGLALALDRLRAALAGLTRRARAVWAVAGAAVLAGLLIVPPLVYRPYYLAYYNPLLGGGATAQQVLLAGWGEGMEQAGAWLAARPDLRSGPVLSWIPATLAPFVPADVAVHDLDVDTIVKPAGYAVVYASVAERDSRAAAEAYALQTPPLYTLRVHGVDYLSVHQLPRPFDRAVGAVFGGIHLRGYSQAIVGSTLTITPSWDIQAGRPGGVFAFVHILDGAGNRVAQIDAPIDGGMFAEWQAGQQFDVPLPIALPADLPPGEYQAVLGLYTLPDGARVPLTFARDGALPDSVAGPNVIRLLGLEIAEGRPPRIAE